MSDLITAAAPGTRPQVSAWSPFTYWRLLFLVGGPLLMVGALTHPRGPGMAAMMADSAWFLSHLSQLLGYGAITAALVLLRRIGGGPARHWMLLAICAGALQTLEAVFHLSAMVDLNRLNAGSSTPVLSTHLSMAAIIYPVFAISMCGLIVAGARQRALGTWWFAPLGILGLALHASAAIVAIVLGYEQFGFLFPGIALFGLWALLTSIRPGRGRGQAALPEAGR